MVMSVIPVIVGSMVILIVILVIGTGRCVTVAGSPAIRTVIVAMFTVGEATIAKISRFCLAELTRNTIRGMELVLQEEKRFTSGRVKRTCGAESVEVV